ncbi:PE-PPE domain-containing protein [Mycobacterium sp. M26]|uniref:PE-PPE domain-containing protein n=1 Tax=Mycobacterium sp. M26 TaxID=1762962 RepID=UPI00073F11F5|nr:PE-PPE domain-containing protein [Mycobacterium sp. M26]
MSIGTAAAVAAATAHLDSTPQVTLAADSTALVLCGTTCPTPDDTFVDIVKNQYISPAYPGQDIDYVAVTTPEESWPITGALRLLGLAFGDPRVFGPGGPAWPDVPLWKLSGLFDLTLDRSIEVGAADLETAIQHHGDDHLVIYGLSQGAVVANVTKRDLAVQYPEGTTAPDIDFVLQGDENLPNGGLLARFPGFHIPILEWTFNGAAPTDTQFDTIEIARQYDGFTDFPLYPLNLVADLNAVLGILYLHTRSFDVSLPADDPTTSPAYQGAHGDTSYYVFPTADLPLFGPLRSLGVPEKLIDIVEPFFRVLVELGYDRSIPPWQPTPARLIPRLNPVKVLTDLAKAVGEGINNALAILGGPPSPDAPAPAVVTSAAAQQEEVPPPAGPEPVGATTTSTARSLPSMRAVNGELRSSTTKPVKPVGRSARSQSKRESAEGARAARPAAAASTGGSAR